MLRDRMMERERDVMFAGRCRHTMVLLGSAISLLVGCTAALEQSADFDRHRYSQLVQPYNKPGAIYFDVRFDPEFPADTPAGDAARSRWLAAWLKQRQLCPDGFDVVARRPFAYLEDNPAGYDQRWEVRCRAPAGDAEPTASAGH